MKQISTRSKLISIFVAAVAIAFIAGGSFSPLLTRSARYVRQAAAKKMMAWAQHELGAPAAGPPSASADVNDSRPKCDALPVSAPVAPAPPPATIAESRSADAGATPAKTSARRPRAKPPSKHDGDGFERDFE